MNDNIKALILDCYMCCGKERAVFIALVKKTTGLKREECFSGYLETLQFDS